MKGTPHQLYESFAFDERRFSIAALKAVSEQYEQRARLAETAIDDVLNDTQIRAIRGIVQDEIANALEDLRSELRGDPYVLEYGV